MNIEPMRADHADQVLAIYQLGIDEGNATFETTAPSWESFDATRIPDHRVRRSRRRRGGGRLGRRRPGLRPLCLRRRG